MILEGEADMTPEFASVMFGIHITVGVAANGIGKVTAVVPVYGPPPVV